MPTSATLAPRFEFIDFVSKFPPVTPPIILGEDTHHTFSTENEPLSDAMIAQFILPLEQVTEADEFTEYVPCFAVDCDEDFIALVWWKASLLRYEYFLATFTDKGQPVQHRVIAFTEVDGEFVRHAVATIDEELGIHIAEGAGKEDNFDPLASKTRQYYLLDDGRIGGA
jgi:hypothetical protein